MNVMLLAETNDAEPYLNSAEWCMQEKLNGERCLLKWDGAKLSAFNRRGLETAATLIIPKDTKRFLIDGELVGDKFTAFDLLSCDGSSIEEFPQWARFSRLMNFSLFPVVISTRLESTKRAALASIQENSGEGVVFKRQDAKYRDGRSPDCVKFKFWKSESFRVAGVSPHGSIKLERDGKDCGSVRFDLFNGAPAIGSVVEVRFSSWTKNGKLAHPVCLGQRKDIDPLTV